MTPSIPDDKETKLFHAKLKEACDKSDDNYYSDFKKIVMNISILHTEMNPEELVAFFLII